MNTLPLKKRAKVLHTLASTAQQYGVHNAQANHSKVGYEIRTRLVAHIVCYICMSKSIILSLITIPSLYSIFCVYQIEMSKVTGLEPNGGAR